MPKDPSRHDLDGARYELRVWGKHRRPRRLLAELASESTIERVKDCYLLVDDPSWNAKIRDNTLKIKQLIAARKGFEQWTSDRHRSAEDEWKRTVCEYRPHHASTRTGKRSK